MVSSWLLKALWPAHSKKYHFCPSVRPFPVLNYFHGCLCVSHTYVQVGEEKKKENRGQRKQTQAHSRMTKISGTRFQDVSCICMRSWGC